MRDLLGAAECVVFEAETFLAMAKSGSPIDCDPSELEEVEVERGVPHLDRQRFEKISEIVKSFRKTCQRTGEAFTGFETAFDGLSVVLEPMSKNTYILVVSVDPRVREFTGNVAFQLTPDAGLIKYNIAEAHCHLAEVGTWTTFTRKCNICRESIKTMPDLAYAPKGEDDPKVRAWDDVGINVKERA
jgi:Ras-related GTP-binding protein A/B